MPRPMQWKAILSWKIINRKVFLEEIISKIRMQHQTLGQLKIEPGLS